MRKPSQTHARLSTWAALSLLTISLTAPSAGGADALQERLAAMRAISSSEILSLIQDLASPRYGGRYTGTPEFKAMAERLAAEFQSWGVRPGADGNSYLQPWPVAYTVPGKNFRLGIATASGMQDYVLYEDYMPALFTATAKVRAPLVFVGYGITAPGFGYDDYQGIDVSNKLVLVVKGMPTKDTDKWSRYDDHRVRMKNARDHGALGAVYVYMPIAVPNGNWQDKFAVALVGSKVGSEAFAGTGRDYAATLKKIEESSRPMSFDTGKTFVLETESVHHPAAEAHNLVGFVEGSDPALKSEVVVIGAHMDHCGSSPALFPGAQDNASGTATLMQIAKAFAACPTKPKRSVAFVGFGGEEMGLLGSKYYASHLPTRLRTMAAMINIDMAGVGNLIRATGGEKFANLYASFTAANDAFIHARLENSELHLPANSDFGPFLDLGVPVLNLSSGSDKPRGGPMLWHTPRDTPSLINPEIAQAIARLTFMAAYEYANR